MDWISSMLLATVRLAIPLLLISLAELYGQRAGMVNIGLEGLAAIGALVGFLACYITGSNWLGLLCGALAGLLVNMIYAFSTVTLCADHTAPWCTSRSCWWCSRPCFSTAPVRA